MTLHFCCVAAASKHSQVDCAVASVVAAVTEASESVRRVRVALRVPGASVLFAAPEVTCAGGTAATSGDGAAGVPSAAVHAVGGKPHYIELSGLAASGGGNLRMRQLGLRVDADCCMHYTIDGSDPVGCEDQTVGTPQAMQEQPQPLHQHKTAPIIGISAQSASDTNCSNDTTASGGSVNGVASSSSNEGVNGDINKNCTASSSGNCGSICLSAGVKHREDLAQKMPLRMKTPSSPQQL